jgi:hypothetical protein
MVCVLGTGNAERRGLMGCWTVGTEFSGHSDVAGCKFHLPIEREWDRRLMADFRRREKPRRLFREVSVLVLVGVSIQDANICLVQLENVTRLPRTKIWMKTDDIDRTKRVKEARDEAKKEIEDYRKEKDDEFKKFESEVRTPHLFLRRGSWGLLE